MKAALKLNEEKFASMGYRDLTLVRESGDDGLFRARSPEGQAVLIRLQVQSDSDSLAAQRFEHEFSFAHELNPDHVVRPLKIERLAHSTALVFEDCGYPPLTDLLGAPLGIKTFLRVAIGITDALADIHQQGIVHRDLRPDNIFVSEEGEAKLGGFGLASRVPREWYKPIQPGKTTATLPYIAPEQTGRMNRSSDARSDLYSLGVLFYRMLTGKLPFEASDPLEWVYCHIAVQPMTPWEQMPTVPISLSELVMKLLAKAAEDRYQTASGLKFDLQHCQQQWLESGATQPFKLARRDIPHNLIIPEKLYGREAEFKVLLDGLERVTTSGNVELLLVSGYSGVGKSALISEMHRSLVSSRAFFAEGKFDQYKQDTPYATLAQALQSLIRQILAKTEEEVAQWCDALSEALRPNGCLVTDLVPDLELLIGEQSEVAEVPPQDAQNRFNHVMRRLIEVFARSEHPLVLFLDDLQWLDNASLQVLEHLLSRSGIKHLLLLGAYRDNEVGQDHPLRQSIEVLRERRVRVSEISLKPLQIDDLRQLIADALNIDTGQANPLAQLIQGKTGGNPFFATQLLSSLVEENLLVFDLETMKWDWDLPAIQAKEYSENVVDLMLDKLSVLPDEAQQALKQLSCFGIGTEIDFLAGVFDRTETSLHKALWGAVQAGLILRDKSSYRFLHDRVQEAAYAMIPRQDRARLHLEIGRQLVARSNLNELDDILFDVVDHLNRGGELISDPDEIIQLAEFNAAAGRKAFASIAYAKAGELFSTAATLLSDDAWVERYDFQFSLFSDWAQVEFLLGEHERAEHIFSILLDRAASDLDLARVHRLRLTLYPVVGQYEKALNTGIEGLRLLAQVIPADEDAIGGAIEYEARALTSQLEKQSIRDIPDGPEVTDERARILIDLLTGIAGPAYISKPVLYPLFAYMNLNQVLRHGVTKEASHALSAYAVMEVSSFGNLNVAYESSQAAISLAERFAEPGTLGSVLYLHGNHVNFWVNPFGSDFPIMEKAFHACIDGGNLAFANYVGYSIVWQAIERGDELARVLELSAEYAAFALDSGNEPVRESIVLEQQFIRCLLGKTDSEISFSDEMIDEAVCVSTIEKGAFLPGLAYYHKLKILTAYLMGDNVAAQFHVLEAKKYHPMVLSQPMQAMFHFLDALVLARSYKANDDEQRAQILSTITEHERKLAFWAEYSPQNFSCKHTLVAAELAVLQNEMLVAEQLFERACESARASRFVHWQAMASEAAARFYADRGLQTVARGYLRDARDCYLRWGASAKVRQLEKEYPWLEPALASNPDLLNVQIDTAALVKASQSLSGEFDLARLIKSLMTLTLESGGADRGLLLLQRDRGFEVEVQATALDAEVQVEQMHTPVNRSQCAESVVNRVINTRQSALIDNVLQPGEYTADPYFQHTNAKCVCCIPLLRQDKLAGLLYLENTQTAGAFTRNRIAVLDVLAAQAAISIENAYLYQDLIDSETQYRDLVQTVQAAIVVHAADTRIITANPMAQDLLGLSEAQLTGRSAIAPNWHFLREDGSVMPVEEYPVNQVLASSSALRNFVAGIDRPDRVEPVWVLVSALPVFDEAHNITQVIVSFADVTVRKEAEQQLAANEQLFRTMVENSPDHIARYDLKLRRIYVNPSLEKQFKVPLEQALFKTSNVNSPLLDPESYMANLRKAIESGQEVADEIAYRIPQGQLRWASSRFAPEFDSDGKVQSVLVISNDITEKKTAEFERQETMHFLESLDRINRVLQGEGDMEQIMNAALQEVLEIFDCDRAYLIYPCDPDAETWSVPMESSRPEYPGAAGQGPQSMEADISSVMRALQDAAQPLRIGPGGIYPISKLARERYHTRAILATMLRPRVDKPWQFGIQQCSAERIWSDQELRLLEEIGHRLSDGLNSLLISRDLRESEARVRQVFENSPVPIQVEDYSSVKTHLESLRPRYGDDLAGYLVGHPEVVKECAALVRYVDINHAAMALHEADNLQDMQEGLPKIFVPETMDDFRDIVLALMRGETSIRRESVLQTLHGRRYSIDAFFSVSPGYQESLERILVSLIDITELKQAELERQQHLHFLESLDRINQVLQLEGDVAEILRRTLDEVLQIFDCDRAYLQYPCDPDAASEWSMPMECNSPDYPSLLPPGGQLPYHPHIEETLRALLATDTPIQLGPHTDRPIPPEVSRNLGVRSFMAIAIHPKVDRPWQFGIHQCSHERVWSDQEERLFEEIAHRLSDGLNNLLITRDLRESEERFRLVYENSPVSIWEEDFSAVKSRLEEIQTQAGDDLDGYLLANPEFVDECASLVRIVNVNSATLALHEADSKEELFAGLPNTFVPESYDAFRKELVAIAAGRTEFMLDGAVQTLNGKRLEVSVSFAVCPGYERTLSKVFVSMFDITQRKQDEDNLRLAASVFSTSQEGIMISDADNRIIDVNPAFTRLTGYRRDEAVGKNPRFLQSGRQNSDFYQEMWRALKQRGKWQGEVWNQRKSGELYPELLSIVAVKDEQEQLQHYVGAFSDISSIKEHEAELARIAHYDVLTGLPNRRLLGDRLEQALAHARRTGRILAVCYLDLDGFKPINDRLGHEFGDQVLVEISTRLLSGSRGDDTVARLGGDEFVLLWNEIETQGDCVRMIERILQIVAEPIELQNESVTVSASIGVTQYPDDDVDADNLLRHADQAMYSAKQLGKNRYQMFDARLERQVVVRSEMLDRIRRGLLGDQFELYYQPKLNYATGTLDGVEALLRWNDPTLGVLGAKEFLPPIEKDSLAYSVGQWVIERALNQARQWNDQGLTMPVSINLFPHHLNYRYFVRDLQRSVKSCWPQMPEHRLVMEIVESTNLEEIESIDQVIGQCRAMGFEFSLDDFGTGYSSLIYLRRLSIEELKIDQSFVRDMLHDPDDEAIVRSVIGLGKAFGLRVVAEGVETREHAQQLVELGCPIVQGYALGRPMSAKAFEKWYEDLTNNGLGDS